MYKKLFWSTLVVLLLLVQYRLWVGEGSFTYWMHLKTSTQEQRAENEALQVRNEQLAARVREYREGQDILEEQARSQLGMIKQDETFIQVVEPEEGLKKSSR